MGGFNRHPLLHHPAPDQAGCDVFKKKVVRSTPPWPGPGGGVGRGKEGIGNREGGEGGHPLRGSFLEDPAPGTSKKNMTRENGTTNCWCFNSERCPPKKSPAVQKHKKKTPVS